jgi:hypothetical protein
MGALDARLCDRAKRELESIDDVSVKRDDFAKDGRQE